MPIISAALLMFVMAIWGFNFTVIKLGLQDFPPLLLATGRFFFAAFPAIFFLPRPSCSWKWVILFGIFSGVGQFSFLFFGISAGMSAGLASVILQSQVFFTLILSMLFFGERIQTPSKIGLLVAVIGVGVIGSIQDASTNPFAITLVLLGALCWAIANTITKKIGEVNMLSFIVWSSLVPIFPLFFASILVDGGSIVKSAIVDISLVGIGSLFYLAYLTTVVGYAIFSNMIKQHGLANVAPFTLVVPVFGIIGSYFVFGDQFDTKKILAVFLVMLGLAIIVLYPRFRHFNREI